MNAPSSIRRLVTWLFLLASLLGCAISAGYIPGIVDAFGFGYPGSLVKELPGFSAWFLGFLPSLPITIYVSIAAAILAAALIQFLGASPEVKAHGISLVALFVYHLLLMLWVGFVVAFFWLPKAKAGI